MGCVSSNQTNAPTKEPKPKTKSSLQTVLNTLIGFSVNYISQKQYIAKLLQIILQKKQLTLLLSKDIFQQVKNSLSALYLNQESRNILIKLLEDYIKYSISKTSDKILQTQFTDTKFAQKFAQIITQLIQNTTMSNHWILQILEYSQKFMQYKFQLQDKQQYIKATKDGKFQCEKDLLAIFYISNYFVESCKKLQSKGKKPFQIASIVKNKATFLKDQYGVKKSKQREQQYLKRQINIEEYQQIKNLSEKYTQISFNFKEQSNKQQFLVQKIMQMVEIGKRNLNYFNSILYENCIENNGFNFKSNLKLSSRENKTSLHRVKEKLLGNYLQSKMVQLKLFPFEQNQRLKKCKTLQQLIKQQSKQVQQLFTEILKNLQTLTFSVSDLLRGKCMFNSPKDINSAANIIIKRIQQEIKMGKNIKLVQIDNRMNKITKDLVFKILIEDLVCQFQFVLSFQKTQNEIHHKMYEIVRSKTLTPISLLWDWNSKSTKAFFSQLQNQLSCPMSPQQLKKRTTTKLQILQFLKLQNKNFNTEDQKYINSNEILNLIQDAKFISQKEKHLKKGFRQRNLKCCAQMLKNELGLKIKEELKQSQNAQILAKEYDCIGDIYSNMGQYQQSLNYYKKSLQIKQKIKGKDHIDCSDTLNNIGIVYDNMAKFHESLEYYERCLAIRQKQKGKQDIDGADTLNNMGIVYRNMADYDKSLQYFQNALAIKQKLKGKAHLDCADILNNVGIVYAITNKYPQALDYYGKSLAIKQKNKGKDNIDCAQTLNNIGIVYDSMHKYNEALDFYGKALAIKQKVLGKDHIQCAFTLNNIGIVYKNMIKYAEALLYYRKALAIYEKTNGMLNLNSAFILQNVANIYMVMRQTQKSLKYYRRVLNIYEKQKFQDTFLVNMIISKILSLEIQKK